MPLTENRPEEYEAVMQQGHYALEHAASLSPFETTSRHSPFLRLWQYPTFAPCISWTCYEQNGQTSSYLIRQVTWDWIYDSSRFHNPLEWVRQGTFAPPTISLRDLHVPQTIIAGYLQTLRDREIPVLLASPGLGLDGTRYGIETYDFLGCAKVSWYEDGPPKWEMFINAAGTLRAWLAQQFFLSRQ